MAKLEVGQRVRVYDTYVQVGEIDAINTSGNIRIKSGSAWYHPKQCRRLIKKPRPKPQERVERWLIPSKAPGGDYLFYDQRPGTIRMVEVRDGEALILVEDLRRMVRGLNEQWNKSTPAQREEMRKTYGLHHPPSVMAALDAVDLKEAK